MDRKFHNIDQNTDEWMDLRSDKITASSFKDFFMGKTTVGYTTAISSIAFARCGEELERFAGNSTTEMGHSEEPKARASYELETFNDIEDGGFWTYGDWCGASPDGLIGEHGLWENKAKVKPNTLIATLKNHKKGIVLNEKTNKAHFWQVHFQLYVTGKDWCDYQLGFSGYQPIIQRIYKDEEVIDRIEEKLSEVIPLIEEEMNIIKQFKIK